MMDVDEKSEFYNLVTRAMQEGLKHTSPSPKTAEHIKKTELGLAMMEKDMEYMKKGMGDLEKGIEGNAEGIRALHKDFMVFVDAVNEKSENAVKEADKRYASKGVEVALKTIGGAVILAVIAALLSLVMPA